MHHGGGVKMFHTVKWERSLNLKIKELPKKATAANHATKRNQSSMSTMYGEDKLISMPPSLSLFLAFNHHQIVTNYSVWSRLFTFGAGAICPVGNSSSQVVAKLISRILSKKHTIVFDTSSEAHTGGNCFFSEVDNYRHYCLLLCTPQPFRLQQMAIFHTL